MNSRSWMFFIRMSAIHGCGCPAAGGACAGGLRADSRGDVRVPQEATASPPVLPFGLSAGSAIGLAAGSAIGLAVGCQAGFVLSGGSWLMARTLPVVGFFFPAFDASFAFAKAESLRKSVVIDVAALLLLPKQSFIRIKVVGKGHILGRELV